MAIVINSTTGEIDLDQTTRGTYVVTYTVQGVSSTQEVTVNAVDDATFSYSPSSYEPTDADPTPTITGLTGGTFSAGSGLVFVDSGTNTGSSTGEIDLSASTIASYTITYDTTSSGSSVCPNTSTQNVEIALAGIANNYSMNFDSASSDYIDAGNDINLNWGTGDGSVSCWFKTTQNVSGAVDLVINGGFSTGGKGYVLYLDANEKVGFYLDDDVSPTTPAQSSGSVADGIWKHVVGVRESGSIKLYLNGSLVSTQTDSTGNIDSTDNLIIGAGTNASSGAIGNFFDGIIDEVAIWNTALTSTQVSEIYNATSTNLTKDLTTVSGSNLVYWNRMGDN